MNNDFPRFLHSVWSSTRYDSPELTRFAREKSISEARRGLVAMSLLTIIILLIEAMLYVRFALDPLYLYTCAILVMLSLNMVFAARTVADAQALHLLGVTLLVVSGSAFVLLAHYQQVFHPMLFASVAMLFIVIPMMSWGLGEALAVTLLIYTMFTLSTLDARFNFADQSLWTLQFIMLGASAVSLSLVARNVRLRKHDVETQHDLVVAHDRITDLSNRDPLTGALNRRYFDQEFDRYLARCRANQNQIHFMLLDVDDFKQINDGCGHECGDRVLGHIGQAFSAVLEDNGRLVRMGGDEFAVVFADLDPRVVAMRGLNRFCDLNAGSEHEKVRNANLSIGVASVPPDIEVGYRQLYKQADLALYRAKSLKDDNRAPPNIVVSVLRDPQDALVSTQTLWNSSAKVTRLDTGAS
ncbi:MAG: GGDEF domain-containing protein [Gammaproteobacteria bacterium]|nr:GGDEF domain-containing protein [Gammaproteobacteria bacterium]MDH3536480.1 GGDEF domain-containing protein [Gammaproteobacteria bacterium]